ncbi:MAG: hypothetical protein R3A45_09155 [Bdellovibrionota bacterium]
MFEVPAPRTAVGIGWDHLPAWLFELGLSKNELAQLALIEHLPDGMAVAKGTLSDENVKSVQSFLAQGIFSLPGMSS